MLIADTLLPYADTNLFLAGVWSAGVPQVDTLHYGHRGPELALYTSAHLTLNLWDMYDDDDDVSVATVILDDGPMRQLLEDDVTGWNGAGSGITRETNLKTYAGPSGESEGAGQGASEAGAKRTGDSGEKQDASTP